MQHTYERKIIRFDIYDGTFRRRATENDAESMIVTRQNRNTKYIYREVIVKGLSGTIESLAIVEGNKGDMFEVVISDDTDFYSIRLHPNSKEAERFCVSLPNIDLDKMLYIAPRKQMVEERPRYSLDIVQNGCKVLRYNTLDNPNGLPMPENPQPAAGRMSDDDYAALKTKRVAFFKEQFLKFAENLKD